MKEPEIKEPKMEDSGTDSDPSRSEVETTAKPGVADLRTGPRLMARPRYLWLLTSMVLIGAAIGLVAWELKSAGVEATEPTSPEHSDHPADLVVVQDNDLSQISVEAVGTQTVRIDQEATGKIGFNADRLTPVFTPYAGRVVELLANKGDTVVAGKPLVVLESTEIVNAQNDLAAARSDLAKAKVELDAANTTNDRAKKLYAREAISAKDLQQAMADLARAQDDYRRTQATLALVESRLEFFGKNPEEIARLGTQVDRRIVLKAPISGTVVDRRVGPGQYVKPDAPDPLFLISDLSTVWVLAAVYESDIAGVRVGAPVQVRVGAFPDRTFPAIISLISPTVDPTTRTVPVRCLVRNPGGLLKPDMFAMIKIGNASQQVVPVVPASAVVSKGNQTVVFVEESSGHFRRRRVQVGREVGGWVVITSGLQSGERVVTRGGLLLDEKANG